MPTIPCTGGSLYRRSSKLLRKPNRKFRQRNSNKKKTKKLYKPGAEQKVNHAISTKYSPYLPPLKQTAAKPNNKVISTAQLQHKTAQAEQKS
jgi:hypothetical protein